MSTDLSKWTVGYGLVDSEASHCQGYRDLLSHPIDLTEHHSTVCSVETQLSHLVIKHQIQ